MGKKKKGRRGATGMARSDIPYAQRLQAQQLGAIKEIRDRSAKITMFCHCIALHELEGGGYKKWLEGRNEGGN